MPEQISECRYTSPARNTVRCLIGEAVVFVPVDPGNCHWQQIVEQQIEVADPE